MKLSILAMTCAAGLATAQASPDVVWSAPTPDGAGSNSVRAVSFSLAGNDLAVGSTDRWFRLRNARDGTLLLSILQPINSHGVRQILRSTNGTWIGVQNESAGLAFRVLRTSDEAFLGNVVGTVGANGIVTFAPDATLLASVGGDGTISSWRFSDLTGFRVTGSGYQTVTTTFNFSPDG